MAMTFPDIAKQYVADIFFKAITDGGDLYLCCFQNNLTPGDATVLADLDEADFGGYARIQLGDYTNWTLGPIDGDDRYPWLYDSTLEFVCDGTSPSNNIYGVYLLCTLADPLQAGPPAEYLLGVQRLTSPPVSMSANGDTIRSIPILRIGACE